MARHAFFIVGDRVVHIANPAGAGVQYHAQLVTLAPTARIEALRHDTAETVLVARHGSLEVMINGATAMVGAGSCVRVPPGITFACRNGGTDAAQVLVRTAPIQPAGAVRRITLQIAAA
ncbi:MAG: cupin domain-containing protein [Devosia sp.]|jgi:mannose-6-phosphate isomerase-like protein (cupin superfamily)|nr:cupin domain-containing protein [Devosia sp.]